MKSLIIHGHFYQPPRENPWTGVVDVEPTAAPFHDWNERVTAECYQPNAAVEVLNGDQKKVVNNYSRISFDFGPTLLSWLEREASETYAGILAADAESVGRHGGHGNAIAQAYSHPILPLCNRRDLITQVRWGLEDFRHRFQRDAESMWLPETACNDDVLGVLIEHGLQFVILAPHQAGRVRPLKGESSSGVTSDLAEWKLVENGILDVTVVYRYFHRDGSNRSIAIFFYDQALAGAIAFDNALTSSGALVDRIGAARPGAGALVNVATDGESYGHHHKFGDMCLAYALEVEAPLQGYRVTNYGEYLEQHAPQFEVELNNGTQEQGSSWSCVHGVGRWNSDCGCSTGAEAHWNQKWRGPLRTALDFLRDEAAAEFEAVRGELFIDPWAARDSSIELVLNHETAREAFVHQHAPAQLTGEQETRALAFLEMQRNTLLMYASCGWFFNDISGIEPVQILKYAARVIDLMSQLGLPSRRNDFLELLAEAKSNRTEMGNGADIYRQLVEPLLDHSGRVLVTR
ncbi:MAG TPA: DUF3536 domain-containing protein [Pyrinomonadaceae bacterium]|nr:DUF3536 domain-containing protein [Pyrinomonadaceae bacterium]